MSTFVSLHQRLKPEYANLLKIEIKEVLGHTAYQLCIGEQCVYESPYVKESVALCKQYVSDILLSQQECSLSTLASRLDLLRTLSLRLDIAIVNNRLTIKNDNVKTELAIYDQDKLTEIAVSYIRLLGENVTEMLGSVEQDSQKIAEQNTKVWADHTDADHLMQIMHDPFFRQQNFQRIEKNSVDEPRAFAVYYDHLQGIEKSFAFSTRVGNNGEMRGDVLAKRLQNKAYDSLFALLSDEGSLTSAENSTYKMGVEVEIATAFVANFGCRLSKAQLADIARAIQDLPVGETSYGKILPILDQEDMPHTWANMWHLSRKEN
jgi:hypothetical protein